MKEFGELTQPELLALTDEDIARYIDLAAAEEGVALLPSPPTPPEKTADNTPDLTVYTIAGCSFTNKSEALNVRDEINKAKTRVRLEYASGRYTYSGPMKAVADNDAQELSESKVFSEYNADSRATSLAAQTAAEEEYRTARTNYDRTVQWREEARKPIVAAIRDARHAYSMKLFLVGEHSRYMELAGNNRRIAARFLEHAHKDAPTLFPEAFEFAPSDPPDPKPRMYHNDEGPKTEVEQDTVF